MTPGDIPVISQFLNLGVGGAIAVLVLILWRMDRRTWSSVYEEDRKHSEERYVALAQEFRIIVRDNTAAMIRLAELIGSRYEKP